ncbi:hypothetical protein ACFVS2_25840 [Brevibacillus sp. NPDC058079]|uniref:hypothetical protein n=1 Tax=Brevibacillus sp. NPDC058079 TaxID=3346330 RepID=UPI0036E5E84F
MDLNQVIYLGNQITEQSGHGYEIIFAVVMIIGVLLLCFGLSNDIWVLFLTGVLLVIVPISLLAVFGDIFQTYQLNEYHKSVAQWKREVVNPYIESLPKEKKEIVFLKIETELSTELKDNRWYTYSSEVQQTPLTVSFKDKGITTLTNWYDASMELTNERKPYIEYQKVPEDLGHGMDKGFYNVRIYLPESYTFTEIK